jgi:hypothetical protein
VNGQNNNRGQNNKNGGQNNASRTVNTVEYLATGSLTYMLLLQAEIPKYIPNLALPPSPGFLLFFYFFNINI